MKPMEVIEKIELDKSKIKSNGKYYVYEIADSDEFSHLYNLFDDSNEFEEDVDSQDINLFTNTMVFIDNDGETDCTLEADFEEDTYKLVLTEI